MSDDQAKKCLERYGMTNCPKIDVACLCEGCTGGLKFDGTTKDNAKAFLMCNVCGCTYYVGSRQ